MPDKIREAFDQFAKKAEGLPRDSVQNIAHSATFRAGARWALDAAAARLEEILKTEPDDGSRDIYGLAADAVRKLGSKS